MEKFEVKEDRENANRYKDIPGWGIDADPENRPNYPMKNYTGADHERLNYERPPLQQQTVEVLHSNERQGLTAVFGTSTPPSGISGAIRRFAFKYSESTYTHWMPLVFADRINVIEGIVHDLKNGIIPNLIAERGWKAEWKYNRNGFMKNIAVGVALTAGLIVLLTRKRSKA
jgi:hypothetical protein